jgi:hypothetical protein
MTEVEQTKKRPARRRGHHPLPKDTLAFPGPQHIELLDTVATGDHCTNVIALRPGRK